MTPPWLLLCSDSSSAVTPPWLLLCSDFSLVSTPPWLLLCSDSSLTPPLQWLLLCSDSSLTVGGRFSFTTSSLIVTRKQLGCWRYSYRDKLAEWYGFRRTPRILSFHISFLISFDVIASTKSRLHQICGKHLASSHLNEVLTHKRPVYNNISNSLTPTSKLEKGFRLHATTYIHSYERKKTTSNRR